MNDRCYGETGRFLVRRHLPETCAGDSCRGCDPCPRRHCYLCGKAHAVDVCGSCLTGIRRDLSAIRSSYRLLLGEALYGGSNGHLEAARPIPGGEAMVLLGPASYAEDGEDAEDEHPLRILALWSDRWRYWFENPTDLRATIDREVDYLDSNLHRIVAAKPTRDAFPPDVVEMAGQISSTRTFLERVLHDEQGGYRGAPCPNCRTPLRRYVADRIHVAECVGHGALDLCPLPRHIGCGDLGGALEAWTCRGCGNSYGEDEYEVIVEDDYVANAPALPARAIELRTGIPASKIRVWATRGHVRKRGKDDYGRVLYLVEDAERFANRDIEVIA